MRIRRRKKTIVIVERKVAKVKMQTVMNSMKVKGRMREVLKIREEKVARMIVGKRV
jgi:hypothetical protein